MCWNEGRFEAHLKVWRALDGVFCWRIRWDISSWVGIEEEEVEKGLLGKIDFGIENLKKSGMYLGCGRLLGLKIFIFV